MSTQTLADSGNGNGGSGNASANGNHGWTSNPYNPAYDHPYRHGAIPTLEGKAKIEQWNADNNPSVQMDRQHAGAAQPTASAGQLSYGGGIQGVGVMSGGKSKVYLIFYGNQWGSQTTDSSGNMVFSNDSAGAAQAAQNMFKGIGTNNELWSAELTQWCDGSTVSSGSTSCPSNTPAANFVPYQQGGVLAGVWYDNSVASPAQATGNQLGAEALAAAHHFGNTTAASNRQAYYVILSPTGVNPDDYKNPTTGYCAWHDYNGDTTLTGGAVTSDVGPFAFSNQPYNIDQGSSCGVGFVNGTSSGQLDGYTMTLGHEWHETLSDQFPAGGWTNHTGGANNGQENSDECAWLAPGTAGGAANVAFSTGTFAEQASWSNDTGNCAISHAIVSHGSPGTPTANFSFTTNGLTANFTDSSTDAGGTIGTHSWTFGDGATSSATNPSHAYASAGTYSVTETVADSVDSTKTSSKTSSVTVTAPAGSVLQNGVGITIADSVTNHQQNWTMTVPAGATNLKFAISGGTGDADLYVKFGSAPTLTSYDCRPYITGNNESCPIATAQAGTYYVMVNAYAAYSGVTLVGSYTAPGAGGTPTANFTFTTSGLSATFTDTSTDSGGTIGTYAWNFGDGTTSSTKSPSHTYATGGTYNVTETVTDSTSGKTSSKTSAVSVSGGSTPTQLFANTGFEGTLSPWSGSSGVDCSTGCAGQSAHSGTGFVWLDGYGSTHTDTLSQTVTVPAGKTTGTVSFYLHIDTAETTTTTAYDTLTVKLGSTTLATFSNLNAAAGYQLHSYNVNVTAGQSLTLTFTGTEDSSNQTSFVIDDVTFTAQ